MKIYHRKEYRLRTGLKIGGDKSRPLCCRSTAIHVNRFCLILLIGLYLCLPSSTLSAVHSQYVQHVEQGFIHLFRGDNSGAISAFEAALALEPHHFEILHYLGMAYAQEEFWNKAVETYQRALETLQTETGGDADETNPQTASFGVKIEVLYSLGVVYFKLDNWNEAVDVLQEVVKFSPGHARGHEVLGKSFVKLRRYSEAVDSLTAALALRPDAAGIYQELGTAYLNLKRYPEAIESFDNAIRFGPPGYAEPHYGLGTAYLRLGDREKSRAALLLFQRLQKEFAEYERLTRLTRSEPENLDGWAGVAKLLMRQKNYGEAIRVFRKCIELAPDNANFYHGLSQAFINLNYPKPAEEAARQALQLAEAAPNSTPPTVLAVLYNTLGSTYAMQGDVQRAINVFRKAIELDGEQPYYHLNLAKLYESLGKPALAQEHYRAYEHYKSTLSEQK